MLGVGVLGPLIFLVPLGLPRASYRFEGLQLTNTEIQTQVGFKLYRKLELDTLKKYTAAHGHKVSLTSEL